MGESGALGNTLGYSTHAENPSGEQISSSIAKLKRSGKFPGPRDTGKPNQNSVVYVLTGTQED